MEKTCYFISDAHLGINLGNYKDREKDLTSFLETIRTCEELFIVGDLFDFWIEYKYLIRSDYFNVLNSLYNLIKLGTKITYLAGNHDFALGNFLSDTLGIQIYYNSLIKNIQGRQVYIYHGDGIVKSDFGYRLLKKILRNPLNQKLYKVLHPNIGISLANFFSGSSRKMLSHWLTEEKLEEYRKQAKSLLKQFDIVIFGHTHRPEIISFGENKIYVNTGEWIRTYNYAKMENGNISLWQWFPDKPSLEILPKQKE
jgi:UDP-2,3-diacylglucosamine hydrolase